MVADAILQVRQECLSALRGVGQRRQTLLLGGEKSRASELSTFKYGELFDHFTLTAKQGVLQYNQPRKQRQGILERNSESNYKNFKRIFTM